MLEAIPVSTIEIAFTGQESTISLAFCKNHWMIYPLSEALAFPSSSSTNKSVATIHAPQTNTFV
mgnify:CR=1 FL=1